MNIMPTAATLMDVGNYLPVNVGQHSKRLECSSPLLCEHKSCIIHPLFYLLPQYPMVIMHVRDYNAECLMVELGKTLLCWCTLLYLVSQQQSERQEGVKLEDSITVYYTRTCKRNFIYTYVPYQNWCGYILQFLITKTVLGCQKTNGINPRSAIRRQQRQQHTAVHHI
jgi:hypothetical protein